ncbi:hypothetical protein SRHO_G00278520 [Serrasalmus rhombeus]
MEGISYFTVLWTGVLLAGESKPTPFLLTTCARSEALPGSFSELPSSNKLLVNELIWAEALARCHIELWLHHHEVESLSEPEGLTNPCSTNSCIQSSENHTHI